MKIKNMRRQIKFLNELIEIHSKNPNEKLNQNDSRYCALGRIYNKNLYDIVSLHDVMVENLGWGSYWFGAELYTKNPKRIKLAIRNLFLTRSEKFQGDHIITKKQWCDEARKVVQFIERKLEEKIDKKLEKDRNEDEIPMLG